MQEKNGQVEKYIYILISPAQPKNNYLLNKTQELIRIGVHTSVAALIQTIINYVIFKSQSKSFKPNLLFWHPGTQIGKHGQV